MTEHSHPEHHHHHAPLGMALLLTAGFACVELIGGWLSGSLALIADAVHMVSDVAALGLAALAQRIAARPAHAGMSYGYGRARVLAALVNGLALWVLAIWISWVAVGRLQTRPEVEGDLMLVIAVLGFIVNIIILRWLQHGHDLNTRAAYWHVLGDMLGSLVAIVAGVVIVWTGWMLIDPLLSFVVVLILAWGGWRLIRETLLQLMEGVPVDVDTETLSRAMLAVDGVESVHHVHVWTLPDGQLALSAHICIFHMADWPHMLPRLNKALNDIGLSHATLQAELTTVDCHGGC